MKFPWEQRSTEDHNYEILVWLKAQRDLKVVTIDSLGAFNHVYLKVAGKALDACWDSLTGIGEVRGALPVHGLPEVEALLSFVRERSRYEVNDLITLHREWDPSLIRGEDCIDPMAPRGPMKPPRYQAPPWVRKKPRP